MLVQVQNKDAESVLGESSSAGQLKKQLAKRMLAAEPTHRLNTEAGQGKPSKSHLAVSLEVQAVRAGKSVFFATLAELVHSKRKAELEGKLRERVKFPSRYSLLKRFSRRKAPAWSPRKGGNNVNAGLTAQRQGWGNLL